MRALLYMMHKGKVCKRRNSIQKMHSAKRQLNGGEGSVTRRALLLTVELEAAVVVVTAILVNPVTGLWEQ